MFDSPHMAEQSSLDYFTFLRKELIVDRDISDNSDVVQIKVEDQVFRCHRNILASNSGYFAAVFKVKEYPQAGPKEFSVTLSSNQVKKCALPCLIDAMYGEPLNILADNVIPLFITSSYLQLTFFIQQCDSFIRKNIHDIDIFKLLTIPLFRFHQSLYVFVKEFVCRHFASVYLRLLDMPLEIFEHLFSHPELFNPQNKKYVLDFGRMWIAHDLEQRTLHLWKVSSILKPFYSPSDKSLTRVIVGILDNSLKSENDVKVALHTLLEFRSDERHDQMKYGIFDTDCKQLREKIAMYDSEEKEMRTNEMRLGSSSRSRSPLIVSESNANDSCTLTSHQPFNWKLSCKKLLQLLWTNKDSEPFRQSNDEGSRLNCTEIADMPADLNNLQKKLDNNEYNSPYELWKDIKILIFHSKHYSTPDTRERIYEMAGRLSHLVDRQMRTIISRYRIIVKKGQSVEVRSSTGTSIEDTVMCETLSTSGDSSNLQVIEENVNQPDFLEPMIIDNTYETKLREISTAKIQDNIIFVDVKQESDNEV